MCAAFDFAVTHVVGKPLGDSGFHHAGIILRTRWGSSPSHSGFVAVESKIELVLNSSSSPCAAAAFVLARIAFTCAALIGRNVRTASSACSRIFMLSHPVMTTDV